MISLGLNKAAAKISYPASPVSLPSLHEAQRWCSLPAPIKHGLRSPELNPSDTLNIPHREDIHRLVQEKYEAYRRAVEEVIGKRSALLRGMVTGTETTSPESKGRLLRYYPLETVDDGAAEASSKGFFDFNDAPPWDTWVAYLDGAIISWIPEPLIARAQAGIDANPVDCIHWMDGYKPA